MEILEFMARAGFYLTLVITLVAAVLVVTLRNLFHAALALVLALLGIAAAYLSLKAEFMAIIQVLLYVGAIMVLVIYAIMLTHNLTDRTVRQSNKQSLPAFIALAFLNILFISAVTKTSWNISEEAMTAVVNAKTLGVALMTEYVLPFEISSVVLIVALVGAIILGRQES